jgi:hypothetical protein
MSESHDVNFKDEPLFDHCIIKPEGVKDTNGETWVCDEGEHEQPYPLVNDAGYITLADQHQMERDANPSGGPTCAHHTCTTDWVDDHSDEGCPACHFGCDCDDECPAPDCDLTIKECWDASDARQRRRTNDQKRIG